jgi:hypothetical protein
MKIASWNGVNGSIPFVSLMAVSLVACYAPTAQDGLRPIDIAVLEVVLNDLANRSFGSYPGGGTTYVSRDSLGENEFYLGDSQLASDLRDRAIPVGVASSLRSRNRAVMPLCDGCAETLSMKIGDYHPISDHDYRDEDYPDCKLIATFWVPGYSADGAYAMVRFSIAPTSHGAIGTYFL